jgi:hypothetical protein
MAEEAVTFVRALENRSEAVVLHAELEGAQHAFEVFEGPRTAFAVRAVAAFLEHIRAQEQDERAA